MKKSALPDHVYLDGVVSDDRVRRFAEASVNDQRVALSALRSRAADTTSLLTATVGNLALVIALMALFAQGAPLLAKSEGLLRLGELDERQSAFVFMSGLVVCIAFLGYTLDTAVVRVQRANKRARVLLAAYEDELHRRWNSRGWKSRQWRRHHEWR